MTVDQELDVVLERLHRMVPIERAKAAGVLVDRHRRAMCATAAVRAAAIAEAWDGGATYAEIGAALGISAGRAQQIHRPPKQKGTS